MATTPRHPDGRFITGIGGGGNGRPKGVEAAIRSLLGPNCEKGLQWCWDVIQGKPLPMLDEKGNPVVVPAGAVDLESYASPELRAALCRWLVERAEGKARENVQVDAVIPPTANAAIKALSNDELLRFVETIRKLKSLPEGGAGGSP